jgi:hypothetical protein
MRRRGACADPTSATIGSYARWPARAGLARCDLARPFSHVVHPVSAPGPEGGGSAVLVRGITRVRVGAQPLDEGF